MPYKLTVRNNGQSYNPDTHTWEDSDSVTEYEDARLTNALAEFLYAVDDGEKVTLKYSPPKTKKMK